MRFLNRTKYEKKLENLKRKNEIAKQKNELIAEKNKYKKKTTTSKLLLVVVVLLCLEIIIFSQYVMVKFQDLTALYTLISVPVTIVPVALGYFYKSKSENTVNGIVYETAMRQLEAGNEGGVPHAGAEVVNVVNTVNDVNKTNDEYVDINNYSTINTEV